MVLTFDDEFTTLSASDPADAQGKLWETNFYYNGLTQSNNSSYLPLDPAVCGLGLTPFNISNGVLDIHAQPTDPSLAACGVSNPYTAGNLDTHGSFSQQYGYFEARAKVSNVYGTIFAFWMIPEDGAWPPEIDMPEILGKEPNIDHLSNHTGSNNSLTTFAPDVGDLSQDFHNYGVLWDANNITYYLDGQQVAQTPTGPDENVPMYLITGLGIGNCGDGGRLPAMVLLAPIYNLIMSARGSSPIKILVHASVIVRQQYLQPAVLALVLPAAVRARLRAVVPRHRVQAAR